jgi:ATP-binding cassette subfamily C protein
MRLIFIIFRQYPWQTVAMLIALMLSGIVEGIGLSAMLPLLAIVLGGLKGASEASAKQVTPAEKMIQDIFDTFGLTPTLELLLILIFAAMLLKCVLVWVANKRVGYTVAHLTTKLRLQVLRAFILAQWEFHLSQPIGKLAAAISGETAKTARAYAAGVAIIVVVIHAIIYIAVAFMVSWKATLIALAVGTFVWYPLNRFVKKEGHGAGGQGRNHSGCENQKNTKGPAKGNYQQGVFVRLSGRHKGDIYAGWRLRDDCHLGHGADDCHDFDPFTGPYNGQAEQNPETVSAGGHP